MEKNSRIPFSLFSRDKSAPHLPWNIYMVCVCEGVFVWCHLGERKVEQTVNIRTENKQKPYIQTSGHKAAALKANATAIAHFIEGEEEEEKKLANGPKVPDAIPAEKENGIE